MPASLSTADRVSAPPEPRQGATPGSRAGWLSRLGWSLQVQAWVITATVLLVLGGLLVFAVSAVTYRSAEVLEKQWTAARVEQLRNALRFEADSLARVCQDYANWIETYEFIDNPNLPYIERNLLPTMFSNLQLDAVLLFHRDGRLRLGRTYDGQTVSEAGVEPLSAALRAAARRAATGNGTAIKGFVRIGERIAVVAVLPILLDDGSGPPSGAMAEIRFLGPRRIVNLAELLDLDVGVATFDERQAAARLGAGGADYETVLLSDRVIEARLTLRDIDDTPFGVIWLRLPRDSHLQAQHSTRALYGMIAALVLITALVVGYVARIAVIARVEALHRAVQSVRTTADLSQRVPVEGADEISGLAEAVNGMLNALDTSHQEAERIQKHLLDADKMEAVATMAGGLAHDFNNLITGIHGSAALIRMDHEVDAELDRNLTRIEQSSARAAALVRKLMAFAREGTTVLMDLRLSVVVHDALALASPSLPRGIRIEVHNTATRDLVHGDPNQLQQVLYNLLTNASHAMAGGEGSITIELANVLLPDPRRPETAAAKGDYIRMIVRDTGCGIAPENLPRIFEPFFTTKPVGSGTGLGLAVVHGVVRAHHGVVSVETVVGRGTAFIIHLPVRSAPAPDPMPGVTRAPRPATILLVDDDTTVRSFLEAAIRRFGYKVVTAENGVAALRLFREASEPFDLVITDQLMPGMTGIELGRQLTQAHKGVRLILISGYAQAVLDDQVSQSGFVALLPKPITAERLAAEIARALGPVPPARSV